MAKKANNVYAQFQTPPPLQNAINRFQSLTRPPNTGINLVTLQQQVNTWMQNYQQQWANRNPNYQRPQPISPFKPQRPVPAPTPPLNQTYVPTQKPMTQRPGPGNPSPVVPKPPKPAAPTPVMGQGGQTGRHSTLNRGR
jgi:hypothetical protein